MFDPKSAVDAALDDPLTEDALAMRFATRHGNDLRFVALNAQWLKWDGTRWRRENTLLAFDLARQSIRADAKSYGNGKPRPGISTAKTVAAVERLAKADRLIAADLDQWDANPWLLNTGDDV
jgi:phage/plasmid-associated DNA primase